MKYIITERQLNYLTEISEGYVMLPMDDIRRPNGSVGTQGYTPEGVIRLVKHISNTYQLNLPDYSSLKELISTIRELPDIKKVIFNYVKTDPIEVTKLPDDTYHVTDGNHRANLLNLLYFNKVPAIVK